MGNKAIIYIYLFKDACSIYCDTICQQLTLDVFLLYQVCETAESNIIDMIYTCLHMSQNKLCFKLHLIFTLRLCVYLMYNLESLR